MIISVASLLEIRFPCQIALRIDLLGTRWEFSSRTVAAHAATHTRPPLLSARIRVFTNAHRRSVLQTFPVPHVRPTNVKIHGDKTPNKRPKCLKCRRLLLVASGVVSFVTHSVVYRWYTAFVATLRDKNRWKLDFP